MQVLSQESLAGNAFRVLGLPADAGQAQIDSAARRMRLWSDPAQVPPTPWDVPWLAPLSRGRHDIEMAVARLTEPASRIGQRLYWYADLDAVRPRRPPGRIFGRSIRFPIDAPPHGQPACADHDAALACLASGLIADPAIQSPLRWGGALAWFCRSVESLDYRQWCVSIEEAGDFEKRARREEVMTAMAGVSGSIAESLATQARDALDHDRASACVRLIGLLRATRADEDVRRGLETGICDRIEDMLTTRCRQMQSDLFRNIRWDAGSSAPAVRANLAKCRRTAREIRRSIDPLFAAMSEVETSVPPSSAASDRMQRVGVHASGMLRNLGLGWGRVGQRRKARCAFRRAAQLTDDREMTAKLKADLADLATQKKKPAAKASGRAWVVVAIVLGLGRLVASLSSDNGSSRSSDVPNYRELEHEREMRTQTFQPWLPSTMPSPPITSGWDSFLRPPATSGDASGVSIPDRQPSTEPASVDKSNGEPSSTGTPPAGSP